MLAGITALFTCYNVNAMFVYNSTSNQICKNGYFPNCSEYLYLHGFTRSQKSSDYEDLNTFYYSLNGNSEFADNRGIYQLSSGNYTVLTDLVSYNDGDYFTFRNGASNTFNYNFINIYKDGNYLSFSRWSDLNKKYNSINAIDLPDLLNGDRFDYFAPWHGSFTFYNKDYLSGVNTVQYIGNKILTNYVIYVDPLDSDENIWLVDYDKLKAYSFSSSDQSVINSFMFGSADIGNYNYIDSLPWENSYTLHLVDGGNYFYPPTDGNRFCNILNGNYNGQGNDCKTSPYMNIGFSYSSDLEFQAPNYGNSNNNGNSSSNVIDYQKCVYDHQPINMMSKYMYSCKNTIDGEHTTDEMYSDYLYYMNNFDGSTPYSGLVRSQSCKNMLDYVFTLYSYSSGDLLDYHKRYLMAESYADVNGFDVESLCAMNYSSNQDQQAIDFIGEIQASFNSGYNYFNVPSCNGDLYGKSYPWGNFLLIFVGVWLLFILFSSF